MQTYQLVVTLFLLLPFSISLWNTVRFARIRRADRPESPRRVSVLIPARNEERAIGRCVESLLAQEYPDYEVIVLDDGSEDRTREILAALACEHPRLRVIDGAPLPPGWVGKNWACRQLSASATGELFFFTDADTVHTPESIGAVVGFMERQRLDLLSGVPRQELGSFWERIIVPMASFLYFAYLPNDLITAASAPSLSATNGQLICFERAAYEQIGGHDAVRSQIVEDLELGRLAKRNGLRTALATAVETVRCRMYRSRREVVAGFVKNLFPGFGRSLVAVALFAIQMAVLYVAPVGFVVWGLATGRPDLLALPSLHLAMGAVMRGLLAGRFALGPRQILYHPLAALATIVIAIDSALRYTTGSGADWKGRIYGRS
jgi:chlorobactene glucosyltransferase